jgi:cytochrome c2
MRAIVVTVVTVFMFLCVGGIGVWYGFQSEPASPKPSVAARPVDSPDVIALGKKLTAKHACIQCHTDTGDDVMGPSFRDLWGSIVKYQDGTGDVVDEANLRDSLRDPGEKVMDGFGNLMPSFEGKFSEEEVQALIAYLKSISKHAR